MLSMVGKELKPNAVCKELKPARELGCYMYSVNELFDV